MKTNTFSFLALVLSVQLFGQVYTGPIAKPLSGYGSEGFHTIGIVSFTNPNFPSEDIKIYHPSDVATPVPTLFYSHGFGGNIPVHVIGLLTFIAKKGYAIVFVPYQTTGVSINDRYVNLLEGFRKAAIDYPNIIDTSRVGFLGHSFGGGATFATSYACFTENNWGSNGRFLHSSAPWYLYNITQTELTNYPADTKLVVAIYDDDILNDHRIAADAFLNINIPNSEKDFLKLKTSTVNGYTYTTDHDLPTTYVAYDAMDFYGYYRILDALCDYTFYGNLEGKDVALGNGSFNQITMPTGMQSIEQTDAPSVTYPEANYTFPCSSIVNPRNNYCDIPLSNTSSLTEQTLILFPNPVQSLLNFEVQNMEDLTLEIYTSLGQLIISQNNKNSIDVSELSKGIYYCKMQYQDKRYFKMFIKQ